MQTMQRYSSNIRNWRSPSESRAVTGSHMKLAAGRYVRHIGAARTLQAGCDVSCHRARLLPPCRSLDYTATSADEGVLRLPARSELRADQVTHVFGYNRQLTSKFFVGRVIGAGSFGVVRECVAIATGRKHAVKTIGKLPKRGPATPRYLLKIRTEVEIMQQLGYSLDAVNLKDVFEDNESVHLVMELCEGGALLERIETGVYSEKYIARLTRSILRFVSQCHAKGIIYRDIKPDNFLFLTHDEESPLKATDFGLSIRHWPDEPKLTSRSGTPAYMAPELVMQMYDEKCDIWSVGMLTYQLLTGRFPFWEDVRHQSLQDVWRAIMTTEINWDAAELEPLSRSAVEFLQLLLRRDPEHRPSACQALTHAWVQEEGAAADLPLQGSVVQRLQRFSTYGHLKQVVLRMIADEMTEDMPAAGKVVKVVRDLKALFHELDTDKSGSVSLNELSLGLRRQGYVLADSEVEQLVTKIDADNDGDIVLSEFMTTLLDWHQLQQEPSWQAYLDHAFHRLDVDGDGFISLEELLEKLPRVNYTGGSAEAEVQRCAEAKLMLREADTNGDGKISREEFNDLLRDNHAPDSLSFYDDRLALNMGSGMPASSTGIVPALQAQASL
ncbi:kinase-like domain-containing protein [Haematococcus lacustris]